MGQDGNKDFGEWLIGQQKRKDAIGELARYAKRLKGFRRDMLYHEFRKLLRGNQEIAENSINQATLEYMQYREERKRRWKKLFSMPHERVRGRRRRRPRLR
jgi:hypothetical protein